MEWQKNNTIKITPPNNPKKITGTRFGAILYANPWKTPFEEWCDITRTYQEPYQDNTSTFLGRTLEDRQCKYLQKAYYLERVAKPEDADFYGRDFFKKTHGDFYPKETIFGGMWDGLVIENGKPVGVVECKTTRRSEDWQDENGEPHIPEYYALQGSLYAYLLGLDDVYMVMSIIDDTTYNTMQNLIDEYGLERVSVMIDRNEIKDFVSYTPTNKNSNVFHFRISEKYPDFKDLINYATTWYREYVLKGVSPSYNEQADAEILKVLRADHITPETDINDLLNELDSLTTELDAYYKEVEEKEKRKKSLTEQITEYLKSQFKEGYKEVVVNTDTKTFTLSKSIRKSIDTNKLKTDGLYDNYTTDTESYRLTIKTLKEDK